MATYPTMHFEFDYVLENKEVDMRQENQGTVTTQGEKYRLEFLDNIFLCDGLKTYVISPEDEEINVFEDEDEQLLTPSKLMNFYKEGFTYFWEQLQTVKGKKIQYLKLVPMDSEAEASYFLLGIETDTFQIFSIKEIGKNGTTSLFEIKNFESKQTLPKNTFVFQEEMYLKKAYTINK